MLNFRKISSSDNSYVKLKESNFQIVIEYKKFLERETNEKGLSKKGESGKSGSYCRYILMILLIVNEFHESEMRLDSLDFYNEVKLIKQLNEFAQYNESENRFPSAAINSYIRFWNKRSLMVDDSTLYSSNEMFDAEEAELIPASKEKQDMVTRTTTANNRNAGERRKAFKRVNYCCEGKCNYELFENETNGLPYVEAHHLIPLSLQGNFEKSLDVYPNIVTLCPSCHRKLHYGTKAAKEDIIKRLIKERKSDLLKSKIIIDEEEILLIYGIK